MVEGFRELVVAWEDWRPYADEFRELDDERVLVLDHFSGRGKTSGLEVREVRAEGAVQQRHPRAALRLRRAVGFGGR
jgi:hypothetical protein